MKRYVLSIPIDDTLHHIILREAQDNGISRADVVRHILRQHYDLLRRDRKKQQP